MERKKEGYTIRKITFCAAVLLLLAVFLLPAAVQGEAAVKLDAKYAKHDQFILIVKATNKLHYFKNGELVKTYPVATGKKPSYTPEGFFTVDHKIKNRPYYKEKIKGGDPRNPLGDRWLGLKVTLGKKVSYAYGIHGTNNEKSIGKYVSAGCIRLHNKNVRWLYEEIKTGTPVLIRAK